MARLQLRRTFTAPDSEGWTDFGSAPQTGTVFYVSSSLGDDANDGLTPEEPFETIAAGYAALTTGQDDWLLLKRGDTFPSGSMGSTWNKWGPAAGTWGSSGYMRLGAYGTGDRPEILETAVNIGLPFASSLNAKNVAISDIFFHAEARWNTGTDTNTSVALNFLASSWAGTGFYAQYFLIENCRFRGHSTALTVQNLASHIRVRRCAAYELFRVGDINLSGFFVSAEGVVEFEDVFLYRVQSPETPGPWGGLTHGVYLQEVTGTAEDYSMVGVLAMECADGIMQRPGGRMHRCMTIDCLIPGTYGQAYSGVPTPGGHIADMTGCIHYDPRGANEFSSFFVGNISGGEISDNMFIRAETAVDWDLWLLPENGDNVGVQNCDFLRNWTSGQVAPTTGTGISGNTFTDNLENQGAVSWTLADYLTARGITATQAGYAAHMIAADRGNWLSTHTSLDIINWMRQQEGLASISA